MFMNRKDFCNALLRLFHSVEHLFAISAVVLGAGWFLPPFVCSIIAFYTSEYVSFRTIVSPNQKPAFKSIRLFFQKCDKISTLDSSNRAFRLDGRILQCAFLLFSSIAMSIFISVFLAYSACVYSADSSLGVVPVSCLAGWFCSFFFLATAWLDHSHS